MATSYEVIYLGMLPLVDTTQGNEVAENAGGILGTYGSAVSPLSGQVQSLTADRLSEDDNDSYDLDNGGGHDSFRINGGAAQNFDAVAIYNAVITYVDGTTASITANVFQDVSGKTYLAPEQTSNADQTALTAKAIQSLSLTSVSSSTGDMVADRVAGDFKAPVDGTAGNDNMGVGHTDSQGDMITNGADVIYGGGGNDTVNAGDGGDLVFGDAGNDSINGGAGNDSLFGGDGADTFIVTDGFGTDTISGGESTGHNDTIDLSALTSGVTATVNSETGSITSGVNAISFSQVENFTLTNQADTLSSQYSAGTILAGGGNDTVTTLGHGFVVDGGTGNDTIQATQGQVRFFGGAGDDTLTFGFNGRGLLDGGDGNDLLQGSHNTDTIFGGAGNDTIRAGGAGADRLFGGTGADTFQVAAVGGTPGVGLGTVTIDGGEADAATDTVTFAGHTAAITITFTGNEAATFTDGVTSGQFTGIEAVVMTAQNDVVNASASSASVNVDGGAGNDSLTGGSGDDTLSGGNGNDTLAGGAGADSLAGGTGTDAASYAASSAGVTVNLITGTGSGGDAAGDRLTEIENLTGSGFDDVLTGDAGANVLNGGAGDDTLVGGGGSDSLVGGAGTDTASYAASGAGVTVDLFTGVGSGGDAAGDTLSGIENLTGSAFNDNLTGDAAANTLDGGAGNDQLRGGSGSDTITTGDGADVVIIDDAGGTDTVTDFNLTLVSGKTVDQLDVSDLTNASGNPVTWLDVVVTDTNGNGTGDAILTFPNGESTTLLGITPDQVNGKQEMAQLGIPCFAAGSPILTPTGLRAVETLARGDLVVTQTGPLPVIWAGSRSLGPADLAADPGQRPIHFATGAIGNSLPLRLSPQHAVLIRGSDGSPVLVRAKHLVEARLKGVRIARGVQSVTYHHLLLERHAILSSAGASVESMYPGPMALVSFPPAARLAIAAAIIGGRCVGHQRVIDLADLSLVYGPRCFRLLGRQDATRAAPARVTLWPKANGTRLRGTFRLSGPAPDGADRPRIFYVRQSVTNAHIG